MTRPLALATTGRRVVALGLLLLRGVAAAENLSDFQKAEDAMENGEGCASIPYNSLRSTCESQQRELHPWCDGERGPITCERGVTASLNTKLVQTIKEVDALEREMSTLQRELSSAAADKKAAIQKSLDQKKKELDAAKATQGSQERELAAHRAEAASAVATLEKCIDNRRAVMNVFAAAKDKVTGEQDEEIVPIARELRDAYEASKRGHEIAITGKENALAVCKVEAR